MRKLIVQFFLLFLFIEISHAAPVPGVYTENLANGTLTVQSLFGGDFGIGDISWGVAGDSSWEASGYIRSYQSYGPWVLVDETHLYRSAYSERTGGSGTVQGWAFGDPVGVEYDFTGYGHSNATEYYTRTSSADVWELDYITGIGISIAFYTTIPIKTTRVYEYIFDQSNYETLGDYQYITFDVTDLSYTVEAVPIPNTIVLLGFGLLSFAGIYRGRK